MTADAKELDGRALLRSTGYPIITILDDDRWNRSRPSGFVVVPVRHRVMPVVVDSNGDVGTRQAGGRSEDCRQRFVDFALVAGFDGVVS